WFSIQNVEQWTKNVSDVLSTLDPDNATIYANNAAQYLSALAELQQYTNSQLAAIPAEQRVLVTNHDALGYFAHDYDFTVLGTVIPGRSTLAEPAAADLTALISVMQAKNVCTIFTESSVSDTLANTVATELDTCATVQVLPLYTGALGSAGSGADTYIDMFRSNVDTIVTGLVR
ncbi:MAG: metal ABC transporter substrate-binding protein, partial [Chloroflexota bacterium]